MQGQNRDRRAVRGAGRRRTRGAAALLCCALLVCWTPAGRAADAAAEIAAARTVLEQWIETQRVISKEKRDLALAREMLRERIALVEREVEALRGKIGEAEKSLAEAEKRRADMAGENEQLRAASTALEGTLLGLEERTRKLLPRLPDPVRERVKPLSRRLPEDPASTRLSLAERFQNVVGILNEVNKAGREIHVTSEVRELPDGSSAEVTALYLGIGQGYYVSAGGILAGVGTASPQGWAWKPADHAAAQIAQAIAILKNEQVAAYVRLPLELDEGTEQP